MPEPYKNTFGDKDKTVEPGPSGLLPQAIEKSKNFLNDALNLRWIRSGMNGVANISSAWITNIQEAWMRDTDIEDVKDGQLKNIAEFSHTMPPSVQKVIEERFAAGEKPTLKQIAVLFDHSQWINFFDTPENFTLAGIPYDEKKENLYEGPKGIFRGLDELHRARLYYQYVGRLIPQAVRDSADFEQMFGPATMTDVSGKIVSTDADTRAAIMLKNSVTINKSFRYMLGITKPPSDERQPQDTPFNIAQQSLMHHYWRGGIRRIGEEKLPFATLSAGSDKTKESYMANGLQSRFLQDMERAMGGQLLPGRIDDIAARLNPSLLRGALDPAMGVVEPDDIGVLQSMLAQSKADSLLKRQVGLEDVRRRTDVIKNEKQRNAETLGQTFLNLSGFEKFALIAIAFQVFSSKTMRNMAGGLGLLYFSQRFLLKQEDPINEVWMPTIRGLTQKVSDFTREPLKTFNINFDHQKYTDYEMQRRTILMEQFLSERTRDRMSTSVTGFTLLSDMRLDTLAQHFVITADGSLATLEFWDPNFQKEIQEKLELHGLNKKAAANFFTKDMQPVSYFAPNRSTAASELGTQQISKNVLDAANGLGSVFYMLSIKNPLRKREMQIVEDARGSMSFGSYDNLPYGWVSADPDGDGNYEQVNPRETYVQLVREGMELAMGKSISLVDFVAQEMKANTSPLRVNAMKAPPPKKGPTDDVAKKTNSTADTRKATSTTDEKPKSQSSADDPGRNNTTADDARKDGKPTDDLKKDGGVPDDADRKASTDADPSRRPGTDNEPNRKVSSVDDADNPKNSAGDPVR